MTRTIWPLVLRKRLRDGEDARPWVMKVARDLKERFGRDAKVVDEPMISRRANGQREARLTLHLPDKDSRLLAKIGLSAADVEPEPGNW